MIGWFVEMMIASTLLMLAVMLVRKPAARLFGPRIAYALWLLPALRMVLPAMPQSLVEAAPLPAMATAALPIQLHLPSAAQIIHSIGRVPHVAAASTPADWATPLAWVWLAGAFFTFGLAMFAHGRFLKTIRESGEQIGNVDGVPLWTSSAVEGPLAFGFVAPGVAVPCDFLDRYAPDEREFVLRHEAMHHRRRDIFFNLAALAVQSVHWFNPIAYWAHRAFRADQELACDAAVLAHESAPGRQAYAWALVKSACGAFPAAACAMDGKGQLKRRLAMMNRKTNSRRRALVGGAVIAIAIGTGLGVTASNSIAAPTPKAMRSLVARAVPAVPAAPAAPALPVVAHLVTSPMVPVAPPVPGARQVPAVPLAPATRSVARLADVPNPPAPPAAIRAPEAPEAPEAPVEAARYDRSDPYNIDATVRAAMAQARASMAQARVETARARVNVAQIRRDVAAGLRESLVEIRAERDIPRDIRAKIIASMEREIARFERD